MKEKNILILKAYGREHIAAVVIYMGVVLIFWGISGLYGYEEISKGMFYAVILTAFFGFWGLVIHFVTYRRKCLELMRILEKKGERDAFLIQTNKLQEKLYNDIIRVQEQEKRQMITDYDSRTQGLADYYTMWTHQIKTPIAALQLLLNEEDRKQVPKEAKEELFKIEQYVEMALHYARLDSLSSDLLFQTQDVYAITKQAVKKYAILFIGSGLSFSLKEFDCKAVTDEKWLGFVIEQILANALKYTTQGEISIYGIDGSGEPSAENCAGIVIEDTGIGINSSDLPRIFERGFTGYNGRMNKKSSGIGLYLCKQIMSKMSHTIEVQSQMGQGTKVYMRFHEKVKE